MKQGPAFTFILCQLVLAMEKPNSPKGRGPLMEVVESGTGVIAVVGKELLAVLATDGGIWFVFIWMLDTLELCLFKLTSRDKHNMIQWPCERPRAAV